MDDIVGNLMRDGEQVVSLDATAQIERNAQELVFAVCSLLRKQSEIIP